METEKKAIAVVNGKKVQLEVGQSFGEVINALAVQSGIKHFRVRMIDPETQQLIEVEANKAPEIIQSGMMIDISPHDEAGK